MESDLEPALPAGTLLTDRYRIIRKIGRGGAGQVYEARDEVLARNVAVKVLRPGPHGSSRDVERLRREAQAAVALCHPHAVDVHDLVIGRGDQTFLVMELLEGRTVREVVAEEGPFSPEMAAIVGDQLLDALASAHAIGLVHRDVKPDNVMLLTRARSEDAPFVKVLDFGAVKVSPAVEGMPKLTATNVVLGTWQYVAPEQVRGEEIDGRADVYSVGASLFFALTALRPHQAADAERVTFAMSNDPTPSVRTLRPDVDEELARIIDGALAKDLADRWSSAAAMRVALRAWLARGRPTTSSRGMSLAASLSVPRFARHREEENANDVVCSADRLPTLLDDASSGSISDSFMTRRMDLSGAMPLPAAADEMRTVTMRASSRAVPVASSPHTLVIDTTRVRIPTPPEAFVPALPSALQALPLPAALPTFRGGSPRSTPPLARQLASRAVLVLGGAVLFVLGLLGGGVVFR